MLQIEASVPCGFTVTTGTLLVDARSRLSRTFVRAFRCWIAFMVRSSAKASSEVSGMVRNITYATCAFSASCYAPEAMSQRLLLCTSTLLLCGEAIV